MFAKGLFNKSYDKYPPAALIDRPGCGEEYKTGPWRSEVPVFHREKCNDCMLCWVFCPDLSIITEDKKVTGVDLDHCKGCGICARECPVDALEMVDEGSYEHCEIPGGQNA